MTMAVALMVSMATFADDYTLYIAATAGETGYPLATVQKLTFENGNVVVNKKDGTKESTAISTVSRMYFSTEFPYADEDVNRDGFVNSLDVLKVYKFMQTSTGEESGVIEDVNRDDKVNSLDVLKIYKYMQSH